MNQIDYNQLASFEYFIKNCALKEEQEPFTDLEFLRNRETYCELWSALRIGHLTLFHKNQFEIKWLPPIKSVLKPEERIFWFQSHKVTKVRWLPQDDSHQIFLVLLIRPTVCTYLSIYHKCYQKNTPVSLASYLSTSGTVIVIMIIIIVIIIYFNWEVYDCM